MHYRNKHLEIRKLNQHGFDHIVTLAAFVVAFGISGVAYLEFSHAAPWSGELQLSRDKSVCMDNHYGSRSTGNQIDIWDCNDSPAQNWSVNQLSSNRFTLEDGSSTCADDWGDKVGTGPRNRVYVKSNVCNSKNHAQVWEWNGAKLENVYSHGCINTLNSRANATALIVYSCKGNSSNDLWTEAPQTPPTASQECTLIGGFGEPNDCYVQVGGYQSGFTATGVSANFGVYDPACSGNCQHVVNEFQAGSADEKNIIEYGWTEQSNSAPGAPPLLQIGLWANGDPLDADANFVQVSNTVRMNEALPINGTVANLKIIYVSSSEEWQLFYNGTEVGYYPESIWTSRNTSLTTLSLVFIYGEVLQPGSSIAQGMQMGSGVLGGKPGAATISNYTLYGTSTAPNLSPYAGLKTTQYYGEGNFTSTGFSYGGPGYE